jgi:ribosomal protein S18 acetylase RimI-like enzyme
MSGDELELADEQNKLVHLAWIQARTPGMRVDDHPDLLAVDCGFPTDTFNVVCRARLDPASGSRRIAAVAEAFRSRGHPFTWWIGPADRPRELGAMLVDAGFRMSGTEPGMAADLARLPAADLAPHGLRIVRATTARELRDAAEALASLATPPADEILRFFDAATPALLSRGSPISYYVGYLDGAAVGCAELTVGGGLAGLYNVVTAASHRRKGIGSALTARALLDARAAGYETAVLQASPDGEPLYRRLGFGITGWFTEYQLPREDASGG